ncbi:E3 ubiquitin-protein ligase TRIM39 [Carassius auratus]|uniref:E3 ubiquitin-protein ligase TRIM39-like n=1 Tax=Carassius auratus TaxID=7957 RepID=A0A6P6PM96_CARAU|nr:E3 ubiquitin-protein ligase TRIM39-like [Carassius auratus]XP_026122736.1 E3 ubiquitin-protein ligase TRIM39-like [Carassius auratus]
MASSVSSQVEQFLCSICQDFFSDPATIPCGHNFCMECITQHWDSSMKTECPLCKKDFHLRPDLGINREFRELTERLKRGVSPVQPGAVPCDACTKIKREALKTCLHCEGSFCKTHLEPHNTVAKLKKHKLIDPVKNLQDYICTKHEMPLVLFCRDDQKCVCLSCVTKDHRTHNTVPVEEESEERKSQFGRRQVEVYSMIQSRLKKIEEIKCSVKLSKQSSEKERADIVELFTSLIRSIERCQSELLEVMEQKQTAAQNQAEELIKELVQEITELERRNTELEQLSHTEDHLHLLQIYPSLCRPLDTKIWTGISTDTHLKEDAVRRALTKHQEFLSSAMVKITGTELKRLEKFTVNVTMDPETAHPKLSLSEDDKQAGHGETRQIVPDSPWRFDTCPSILGKEGFSSGKFYFEVQVKGKTEWDLGVARESVNRKGIITLSPRNGLWTLWLRNGSEYKACDCLSVSLCLKVKPQKVGVYVDYEEGLVSFYDVESRSHIYSFTGQAFTEKLYPYFSPGFNHGEKNSAPLIISPVGKNKCILANY